MKSVQSPSRLIDDYAKDANNLKAIFEGYPTAVMRVKEKYANADDLEKMTNTLNVSSKDKFYQSVIGENAEQFIVERTTARKINMGLVLHAMKKIINPLIAKVN